MGVESHPRSPRRASGLEPGLPGGPTRPAILSVLVAAHIVLGVGLISRGATFRVGSGVPFSVVGVWLVAVGIGLLLQKTWAWWSAVIVHPALFLGCLALIAGLIYLSSLATREGSHGGGGFWLLAVFYFVSIAVSALALALLSGATWFVLMRRAMRDMFFRRGGTGAPLPGTAGLGIALAMVTAGAVIPVAWSRATRVPRPPPPAPEARAAVTAASAAPAPSGRRSARPAGDPCAPTPFAVARLAFTPDGSRLVGTAGRAVCVWEAATGRLVATWFAETNSKLETALSPDGKLLAVLESGYDRPSAVELRELETGQRRPPLSVPVQKGMEAPFLSFGPTAATLVVQTSPQTLAVYDTSTGKPRREWGPDGKTRIFPIVLSPSRRRIALAFGGREPVGVTDLETDDGREMDPSPIDPSENIRYGNARLTPGAPTARRIHGMLFSPDESTLYLGRSASVGVVDVGTGRQRRSLDLPRSTRMGSLAPLCVSADGSRLLSHMDDFLYPIFSLPDGELVSEGSPQSIESKATAPVFIEGRLPGSDGYGHAVGHLGHPVTVGLLSRENEPMQVGDQRSHHTDTWGRCVSPDGSILVLALSAMANVTLWDARTGRWIDLLSSWGSFEPEGELVFSSDGKLLAASSRHGLDVFDVAARKRLYRIGGEDHGG